MPYPCCCKKSATKNCFCANCAGTGANAPCCLSIEILDVTNGGCFCHWCPDVNGIYQVVLSSFCAWTGRICSQNRPYSVCGLELLAARLVQVGSDYVLRVTLDQTTTLGRLTWEKNYGPTKPDCSAWSGEVVSFSHSDGEDGKTCDGTGSQVRVTALPGQANQTDCPNGQQCLTRTGCNACNNLLTPEELLVTIPSGWTEGTGCPTGAFVLTRLVSAGQCSYRYIFSSGDFPILDASFGTPCGVAVQLGTAGSSGPDDCPCGFGISWLGSFAEVCGKCDCMTGPWTLPFIGGTYTSCRCATDCRWGTQSVTVEAV